MADAGGAVSFVEPVSAAVRPCANCVRSDVRNHDPDHGPLEFSCSYPHASSTRCGPCAGSKKKTSCTQIGAGLAGNWEEVLGLMDWCDNVYSDVDETGAALAAGVDLAPVWAAQHRLGVAFESLDTQHRSEWGLAGAKKSSRVEEQAYRLHVEERRRFLLSARPAAAGQPLASAIRASLPRLLPGDSLYNFWEAAKEAFRREVLASLTTVSDHVRDVLGRPAVLRSYGCPLNGEF